MASPKTLFRRTLLWTSVISLSTLLVVLGYNYAFSGYVFHHSLIIQAWPERLECLKFSPNGKTFVTGGDSILHVYHLDGTERQVVVPGLEADITSVAFSPDGNLLALTNWDENVVVFETNKWTEKFRLRHVHRVWAVSFCLDGTTLAVGTGDDLQRADSRSEINLWDLQTGKKQRSLQGQPGYARILVSSLDGKTLASTNGANEVELWDLPAGKQVGSLKDPSKITALAFAPVRDLLAVGNETGTITLWDLSAKEKTLAIHAYNYDVYALTFLNDGRYLASGGGRSVKIWDAATGKQLGDLKGVRPPFVYTIDVSSDGTKLAIGARHGPFSIWELLRDKDP